MSDIEGRGTAGAMSAGTANAGAGTDARSVLERLFESVEIIDVDGGGLPLLSERANKGFAFMLGGTRCVFTDTFISYLVGGRNWLVRGVDDTKETLLKLAGQVPFTGEVTELFFDYFRLDDPECPGYVSAAVNKDYGNKRFFDAVTLAPAPDPFDKVSITFGAVRERQNRAHPVLRRPPGSKHSLREYLEDDPPPQGAPPQKNDIPF